LPYRTQFHRKGFTLRDRSLRGTRRNAKLLNRNEGARKEILIAASKLPRFSRFCQISLALVCSPTGPRGKSASHTNLAARMVSRPHHDFLARTQAFYASRSPQTQVADFDSQVGIQAVKLICKFAPKYQQPVGPGNRAQDVGSIPIARSLFPFNNLLSRSRFRVCIRPPSVIPRDCRPFCILTTDGQNLVLTQATVDETPMPIFGCWSV